MIFIITVKNVLDELEVFAPPSYANQWDNCGLLIGRSNAELTGILIALDVTSEAVEEALSLQCNMIVSHHPVFIKLNKLNDLSCQGNLILSLIEKKIAVCCMHTNLDYTQNGVNDALAETLRLPKPYTIIEPIAGTQAGYGRISNLTSDMDLLDFAKSVKTALNSQVLRLYNSLRPVRRIAVCSGAGADTLSRAVDMGCDTFIAGDIKHNVFLEAKEMNVNLIDAGHFATENVVLGVLYKLLSRISKNTHITSVVREPFICL